MFLQEPGSGDQDNTQTLNVGAKTHEKRKRKKRSALFRKHQLKQVVLNYSVQSETSGYISRKKNSFLLRRKMFTYF